MPRIHDRLLMCAAYLYATEEAAHSGSDYGASGFLIGVPSDTIQGRDYIYAVTNCHVITDGFTVLRLSTREGPPVPRPTKPTDWLHEPNGYDVAVALLGHGDVHSYPHFYISAGLCLQTFDVESMQIGPGDDAFMVGRFVGHDGTQRNTPSARFGHISMMPDDDSPVLQVNRGIAKPCYIVEMRSLSGYSGAPVFFHRLVDYVPMDDDPIPEMRRVVGHQERLLGVDCGHFPMPKQVEYQSSERTADGHPIYKEMPDMWYDANSGQATVVPAWILSNLLHSRELTMARRQSDDAIAARLKRQREENRRAAGGPVTDSAAEPKRGPKPERLKIDEPMDSAVRKMFKKGKPPKRP